MTFFQLIQLYGFNPADFKLVRHGYKEIDPLALFRENLDKFFSYQSIMRAKGSKNYDGRDYAAVFAPYHGTQAILLGVWQVKGKRPATKTPKKHLANVKEFGWNLKNAAFYTLKKVPAFDDLAERVIIEWGKSTVSWMQVRDKEVLSILPASQVQEFFSYEQTVLDWQELKRLVANPTGNFTWVNALKSVNGIYCITNLKNGRCYVGSAYGKHGIWGRWQQYAKTGHGDNDQLVELVQKHPTVVKHFQFSILEILPGSSTAEDAIDKEGLWKRKLGTRTGGYNRN